MYKKLKVGVIGLGFIGEKYVNILNDCSLSELVAVSDIDSNKLKLIKEKFACHIYINYLELLARKDIDAVCICLPEVLHKDAAVQAARHGKHILLEKPIAPNASDANIINQECIKNNVRLMIAHILMFDARYVNLFDQVKEGTLGELSHIFMRRQNTVRAAKRFKGSLSFMHYLGIHDVAWMLLYANSKPISVYCKANNVINKPYNDLDNMYVTIEFENGIVGSLFIGWSLPDNSAITMINRLEIVGTKGMAVIDSGNAGYNVITDEKVSYVDTIHWPEFNGYIQGDLRESITHFVRSTIDGTPYFVDTNNAIEAVKVVDHILIANETKKPTIIT